YLVAASDATDSDMVKQAGFLELGSLKGNIGDQNYEIPADVDLAKYRAVTIWCKRFSVNFGTAPLSSRTQPTQSMSQVLASGSFHDVAHKGAGQATIYQLAGGKRVLRFTNFETSNGPDVRVYLVASTDASDSDTVKKAGFVELGALKGNIGDQNYEVTSDLDLSKYRAVTIWCRRFGVNFATAPLSSTATSAMNQ
ncbi:MAG TPA: DM13 domain-containing protein, partial [Terriglobales bacterium]|nr:DM13 domain-containing protein [Terriglobales bacterium]